LAESQDAEYGRAIQASRIGFSRVKAGVRDDVPGPAKPMDAAAGQ
jgi:hypothetical protein